ncbi:MAG: hypothetical protein Q9219_006631 [cf. Caloplaca sp. 3 TL-2023]
MSGMSGSKSEWEISHITGLHTCGKLVPKASHTSLNSTELTPSNANDDRRGGIVAVGFVPGYKAIVVTVGLDGRCCVIDFATPDARQASFVHVWEIPMQATCLAIVLPSPPLSPGLPSVTRDSAHSAAILAIGHQSGLLSLFDITGNLLIHQPSHSIGLAIVDVHWMEGIDWPEPSSPRQTQSFSDTINRPARRKSLGSVLAGGRSVAEEVVAVMEDPERGEGHGEIGPNSMVPLGIGFDKAGEEITSADIAIPHSSAVNYKDLPSAVKKLYPTEASSDNTSAREDTSSSTSREDILKLFQFPTPPNNNHTRVVPQLQWDGGQIKKNNSWAAEFQPYHMAKEKQPQGATSSEASAMTGESSATKSALSKRQRKRRAFQNLGNQVTQVNTQKRTTNDEDAWVDITVDDQLPTDSHAAGSSDKENENHRGVFKTGDDGADSIWETGLILETNLQRDIPGRGHAEPPFTIDVDEHDINDHPQPLRSHPGKIPATGPNPLLPTSRKPLEQTSSAHVSSRRPWYKNGNLEGHRSSIYGPGALARKVHQEVMITVNVELDVLRREMELKFTEQRKWFVKQLLNGQEWALRVEEENRKLREELARERKRAVDREAIRRLC